MNRGDLVTVAWQGDFGKPRPGVVVRADRFEGLGGITFLPMTTTRVDAWLLRIDVEPTPANGLACSSQIMVDRPQTQLRHKVGPVFGKLDDTTMIEVNRALAVFLGLA